MSIVSSNRIDYSTCLYGAFVRWYYNGWHYHMFSNRYTTSINSAINGIHTVERFSPVSSIQNITSRDNSSYINIGSEIIKERDIEAFKGLVLTDTCHILVDGIWEPLEISRDTFTIKPNDINGYQVFITGKIAKNAANKLAVYNPDPVPAALLTFEDHFTDAFLGSGYNKYPPGWTPFWSAGYGSANEYMDQIDGTKLKLYTDPTLAFRQVGVYRTLSDGFYGNISVKINAVNTVGLYIKTFAAGYSDETFIVNGWIMPGVQIVNLTKTLANQLKILYVYAYTPISILTYEPTIDYIKITRNG